MHISRRILAGTAALALSAGLVACSAQEAKDNAASATSAAGDAAASATSAAGNAAGSATSAAGEAGASASSAAKGAGDLQLTSVPSAQGDVEIPSAVATAAEEHQLGEAISVTKGSKDWQYIVEYSDTRYIVNTEDNGGVLVQGKIAETWLHKGGYDSELGQPVSPEKTIDKGWTQEFTKGKIDWVSDTGKLADYHDIIETK
ncbi:hypothetical protein GP475_04290 [Corynebacterium poyangense]|uniref:Uncharacterized protein n=1 Tax=Corynebacterium poyangense TaxID=2684405 RepID=A0A7H0SN24_9CORY|nr:hypothetical protein [Corynebacterium poyangense]MBZ8176962.1 hypothetical protein [Corynebacterium poyangense]QNQ89949.1 hypothetical protein GP475_04290 [Corynebacterium poyangense]